MAKRDLARRINLEVWVSKKMWYSISMCERAIYEKVKAAHPDVTRNEVKATLRRMIGNGDVIRHKDHKNGWWFYMLDNGQEQHRIIPVRKQAQKKVEWLG